jgi:hypothetical protein
LRRVRQQFGRFLAATFVVDRPDRVDHPLGCQSAGCRRLRVAGGAAAEFIALGHDGRPARAMDRPIDPAAAGQPVVGGVDDGIDLLDGDVADQ